MKIKVFNIIVTATESTIFRDLGRVTQHTFLALASRSALVPFFGGLASFGGISEPHQDRVGNQKLLSGRKVRTLIVSPQRATITTDNKPQ